MTTPAIGGIVEFAPPRSLRHRRTKSVRLRRAFEKAEFDQEPDHSDDWDEADQDPPAVPFPKKDNKAPPHPPRQAVSFLTSIIRHTAPN